MVYSLLANSPCLWCLWNSFCCFVSNIAGTWISLNLSKMMLDEHRTLREFFYYLFLSSLFFYSFRILIQFLLVLKKHFVKQWYSLFSNNLMLFRFFLLLRYSDLCAVEHFFSRPFICHSMSFWNVYFGFLLVLWLLLLNFSFYFYEPMDRKTYYI